MNPIFFRIAFGEELTFESLLHHLPHIKAKALAGQPKSLLIVPGRIKPSDLHSGIALGVLIQHLEYLEQSVYGKLNKDETWTDRRKAIARDILPWFANIHRENVIGVSLAQAATLSGFDPQLIRKLVEEQLGASELTFGTQLKADFALSHVLERLRDPSELYSDVAPLLFTEQELKMARSAIEQTQALPLGHALSPKEAMFMLKTRMTVRFGKLKLYMSCDPSHAAEVRSDLTGIAHDIAA
ncbi:MAG: hypothetical protein GC134_06630 [Proteobacteria bacterium]|nr:hypothetical protein [Pseudomonadota bacterium]